MNIFYTDKDPKVCAESLCDKHIPKMVLESAQLLCNSLPAELTPYRRVHQSHPCSKWVGYSNKNYEWLLMHSVALCDEYEFRYGKVHKCLDIISYCYDNFHSIKFESEELTEHALAIKKNVYPELLALNDTILAYRLYYFFDKKRFAKWNKGRLPPNWWLEFEKAYENTL